MDISKALEVFEAYLDEQLCHIRGLRATGDLSLALIKPELPNKSPAGLVNPPTTLAIVGSRCDLPILIPSDDEGALPAALGVRPFASLGSSRSEPINLVSDVEDEEDTRSARKDVPKSQISETVREMTRIVIQRARKRKRESSGSLQALPVPLQAPPVPLQAPPVPLQAPPVPLQAPLVPPQAPHVPPQAPRARVAERSMDLRPTKFPGRVHTIPAMGMSLYLTNEGPEYGQKFFVACSTIGGCAAVGVVWTKPWESDDAWDSEGFAVPYGDGEIATAQMFAVVKGLQLAAERISSSNGAGNASPASPHSVLIFSECGATLERIQRYDSLTGIGAFAKSQKNRGRPKFKELLDDTLAAGEAVWRLGAKIELCLVPARAGIPGCHEAHRMAKETANLMVQRKIMAVRNTVGARSNLGAREHHRVSTQVVPRPAAS